MMDIKKHNYADFKILYLKKKLNRCLALYVSLFMKVHKFTFLELLVVSNIAFWIPVRTCDLRRTVCKPYTSTVTEIRQKRFRISKTLKVNKPICRFLIY